MDLFTRELASPSNKIEIPFTRKAARLLGKTAVPLYKRVGQSLSLDGGNGDSY